MQKRYVLIILFYLMPCAICQLSRRRGFDRSHELEVVDPRPRSRVRTGLRSLERVNLSHNLQRNFIPRRNNFSIIAQSPLKSISDESQDVDFLDITSDFKPTPSFMEVPLFRPKTELVTQIPVPKHKKKRRRRPRPGFRPPPSNQVNLIDQHQGRMEIHQQDVRQHFLGLQRPMHIQTAQKPRQIRVQPILRSSRPPRLRTRPPPVTPRPFMSAMERFRNTFIRTPSTLMTSTLPSQPLMVSRRGRIRRPSQALPVTKLSRPTTQTNFLARRTTLPAILPLTTVTRPPMTPQTFSTRSFTTRLATNTTITTRFSPRTTVTTQRPMTIHQIPSTRTTEPPTRPTTLARIIENSRELNTVGPDLLSSETTHSTRHPSGPSPPPLTISTLHTSSEEEFLSSDDDITHPEFITGPKSSPFAKKSIGPPGFEPPNDQVVDALNNAIDFIAIAKRMKLRSRRLSFMRRFAAQARASAKVVL